MAAPICWQAGCRYVGTAGMLRLYSVGFERRVLLREDDDGGAGACSALWVPVPTGRHVVEVGGKDGAAVEGGVVTVGWEEL